MRVALDSQRTDAYRKGLWVDTTLADSLRAAARTTPSRTLLVDDAVRVNCAALHEKARTLAQALLSRMPAASVVSFMLPNWHEAAVIYLGATLAGMVVNPILASLRERELQFILADSKSRMVFVPRQFGGHHYASMLARVTARMQTPPEVVVVRGEASSAHTPYAALFEEQPGSGELPA